MKTYILYDIFLWITGFDSWRNLREQSNAIGIINNDSYKSISEQYLRALHSRDFAEANRCNSILKEIEKSLDTYNYDQPPR